MSLDDIKVGDKVVVVGPDRLGYGEATVRNDMRGHIFEVTGIHFPFFALRPLSAEMEGGDGESIALDSREFKLEIPDPAYAKALMMGFKRKRGGGFNYPAPP